MIFILIGIILFGIILFRLDITFEYIEDSNVISVKYWNLKQTKRNETLFRL